jgi:ATP-dependent helicase/nuclease subunit A
MSEVHRPLLADAEARRAIHEDLTSTLFIEAAAGTGKTSALVARIVALLREGHAELERIVAVTFTERAAGEMKLRLRAEIEQARAAALSPEQSARLERALAQLELARIGTLHSFCADLLHERPLEAGVDPLFEVAGPDESRRLLDTAFDAWFQRALADPSEALRRALRRKGGRNAPGARAQLRSAAERLVEHRDFPGAWRRPAVDRAGVLDAALATLSAAAELAAHATQAQDYLARNLAELDRFVKENALRENVRGRDHDALEAELRDVLRSRNVHWNWTGFRQKPYGAGISREAAIAARDGARATLETALQACDADLAAALHEELRPVIAHYEQLKARAGQLDFLDLVLRARELVAGDRAVREEFQRRFTHFFVDEFQDTDPLQAELLLLLAADDPAETSWQRALPRAGKLFLVGDPKQSIYRFRRADVAIYERVKQQLVAGGARLLHLSASFRAVPEIQSAVNAAFAPQMQGSEDGSQAHYVALEPVRAGTAQPALVALPAPRIHGDYGDGIVRWQIEESLPHAVGAFVDWLVHESGWTVEERDAPGRRVAIEPRHVCLLFRRFRSFDQDVTRPYVRALEARRLPHVLVGGRSFHHREEVLALRNALCAIEWPDDELRVFATLRGPLFALGDDALLAYRQRVGRLHALRRLDPAKLAGLDAPEREVAEALAVLGRLHVGRNARSSAETLSRLLDSLRAHAGIAVWPTGEQALANCLRVIDLARRFERGGAASFRAFVDHLEEQAERGEIQDAPVVEEGTEGVRIMTVHAAKGLEFPVVVLADPTAHRTGSQPSRAIDVERRVWAETLCGCAPHDLLDAAADELRRDEAEAVRVAYVAATRARDLLVVPVVGQDALEGWIDALDPAVYPEDAARRSAAADPRCPPFGDDSVRVRPGHVAGGPDAAVQPGLHRPRAGAHGVVWWDPKVLEIEREEELGVRQQRILEADASGTAAAESVRAHAEWQSERRRTLDQGLRPLLRAELVTSLAQGDGGALAALPVRIERTGAERASRPGGLRFGTLVHAVLAEIDLAAGETAIELLARARGRLLQASAEEVSAARSAVQTALAHPLLRRAAQAQLRSELRREVALHLRLTDDLLAEGVADLAFRESGRWTVIDFKTDRELAERSAAYEHQVRLYAAAIARATGEPSEAVLLCV